MTAVKIDGKTSGGNRIALASVLPLDTPYLVQIFPMYACNFKCSYCVHSIPHNEREYISDRIRMDLALYKKCIDDLAEFPQKIKMLRFAATGEPLVHPDIAEMVRYAKEKCVAESIDIVTNGSLLTNQLSDRLIDAGLDRLRVSIQGTDAAAYRAVSGVDISYEELLANLTYFYKKKKSTTVYIKTIDMGMNDDEIKTFYSHYSSISDSIAIEHLTPAVPEIDYSQLSNLDMDITQNGNRVFEAEICPQPFYMIQINPEGYVVPCCAMKTAEVVGDSSSESLKEIWNGASLHAFQTMMLKKQKDQNKACRTCENYRYGMFEEDILDRDAERLLKIWSEK